MQAVLVRIPSLLIINQRGVLAALSPRSARRAPPRNRPPCLPSRPWHIFLVVEQDPWDRRIVRFGFVGDTVFCREEGKVHDSVEHAAQDQKMRQDRAAAYWCKRPLVKMESDSQSPVDEEDET